MSSGALGETGTREFDGAEAVEKIFAEASGENFGAQIAIGGGDQADVHGAHFGRTHALDFAILNHAEQLRLHRQRSLADFVEEHGAAVGEFEKAGARVRGAGESAAHVAEELAFEKRVHQRRAIADGESRLGHRAHLVQRVRDQFLA